MCRAAAGARVRAGTNAVTGGWARRHTIKKRPKSSLGVLHPPACAQSSLAAPATTCAKGNTAAAVAFAPARNCAALMRAQPPATASRWQMRWPWCENTSSCRAKSSKRILILNVMMTGKCQPVRAGAREATRRPHTAW